MKYKKQSDKEVKLYHFVFFINFSCSNKEYKIRIYEITMRNSEVIS